MLVPKEPLLTIQFFLQSSSVCLSEEPTRLHQKNNHILEQIVEGKQEAFWSLWSQHAEKLFNRCLYWLNGNKADAEDVMGEAMMKAHGKFKEFYGPLDQVEYWLIRIVHNGCIDLFRHRKVTGEIEPLDNLMTGGQGPDHQLEINQKLFDLLSQTLELPEKWKAAFLLYFLEGYSYSSIATCLETTPPNVRKRIQLARQWIKQRLFAIDEGRLQRKNFSAIQLRDLLNHERDLALQGRPRSRAGDGGGYKMDDSLVFAYHRFREEDVCSKDSISKLETYVRKHPSGWKKHLRLARLYEMDGDWNRAFGAYAGVMKRKPDNFSCAWKMADLLEAASKKRKAAKILEETANHVFEPYKTRILCGRAHFLRGSLIKAKKAFQDALELAPHIPFHGYQLALFLFQTGRLSEAERAVQKVLDIHPQHLPSRCLLIESLRCSRQRERLHQKLKELLQGHPTHLLGLKYWLEESGKEGVDLPGEPSFCRLIDLGRSVPPSTFYLEPLCLFYQRQGKLDEALALLQRYVEAHPKGPGGWYRLAQWQYHRGNKQQAEQALKQANRLNRDIHSGAIELPCQLEDLEKVLSISPLLPTSMCFC